MGGSGGGSSGTISYPTHVTAFHTKILDHGGTDNPENSFIDAFNVAMGGSPFSGAVSYDPSTEVASAVTGVTTLSAAISALNFITDFNTGVSTSRINFPLGTTTLDSTSEMAIDVPYVPLPTVRFNTPSTLDTLVVSPDDIAADVAAMDAILTQQLEEEELPRFRAGMLNINAIHSSAYIIGEALLRASKDRMLLKYGTEMQMKIGEQVREINARHLLSYRDLNSKDSIVTKEINARNLMGVTEIQGNQLTAHRDALIRAQTAQREIDARHKIAKQEIDAKFYIHREELVRMATTSMIANLMQKVGFDAQNAHLNTEVRRLAILAFKESIEEQLTIDESDAKWDIDLFRIAGILLAGPTGGVAQGNDRKSKAVSALGGAISGAAAGAAIGAPTGVGAPIGAAIGAVAGVGLALL